MMAAKAQTTGEPSFDAPVQLFLGRFFAIAAYNVSSYDVAHDGRFLMIEPPGANERAQLGSIVVVQNWAEEIKKRVPKK
jgi:hypothetical protein